MARDDEVGGGGLRGGAEWLGLDDIEAGSSEMSAVQGGEDGGFFYDVAARGIDEERAWFHPGDLIGADHGASGGAEWAVNGDGVGLFQ